MQPHPLHEKLDWLYKDTIKYTQQSEQDWLSDYKSVLTEAVTLETVEEFWRVYHHIPQLTHMNCGSIYAVFKQHIKPAWEHPANEKGWSIVFYINKLNTVDFVNQLYRNALILLACNTIPELNGCTFERKIGGNKIVFWMKDVATMKETEKCTALLNTIVEALEITHADFCVMDDSVRVDWRDNRFQDLKITVKYISHMKRASEPVVEKPVVAAAPPRRPKQSKFTKQQHGRRRK